MRRPSAWLSWPSAWAAAAGVGAPDIAAERAAMTSSSVPRSWVAYPLTVSTRLGMRSWRRFSSTSIWRQPSSTLLRRPIRPLYMTTPTTARSTTRPSRIQTMIMASPESWAVSVPILVRAPPHGPGRWCDGPTRQAVPADSLRCRMPAVACRYDDAPVHGRALAVGGAVGLVLRDRRAGGVGAHPGGAAPTSRLRLGPGARDHRRHLVDDVLLPGREPRRLRASSQEGRPPGGGSRRGRPGRDQARDDGVIGTARNRVDPFGEVVAAPGLGDFMGNRGRL